MSARLDSLKQRLSGYIACEAAILNGAQSYAVGGRNLTRADLHEISSMIKYLENEIQIEESRTQGKRRNRVVGVIPRDF
jgi:hypothetical protein